MLRTAIVAVAAFAAALPLSAQRPFEFWPGASYDARVPTFRQVLGYGPGERITSTAGILKYMDALAGASSGRLKVFEYGESWEGRKLIYAALGSEANVRKAPEIRAAMQRLADPRKTPEAEARKTMEGLPAVVWLSYGVHGDEISSSEAAILTAYHLLAARNDKTVERILDRVLVLIDPTQNPDGRERFVNHFEQTRGLEPDASPLAAEHNQQWPGGRSNHYLFDLNRDWLALTQPEIRSQVKALREWYPLVYVDLHEMGSEATYFFSPEAEPYNPNLTADQRESLKLFGRNNSKWFDRYGFDYFTRDVYDAFYPGYGASWPCYYGALAMTYEQASVRGLAVRRSDETVLTFRDTVQHHFVASISTLETAAENREKLLADFYRYRATAIEEGAKEAVKEYLLPRGRDASATDKLAAILLEHGVEVRRATAAFRVAGREYAAGTYAVAAAQPSKRLVRTLLDPSTPMDQKFLAAEEDRRKQKRRSEIYDVTAWSLPLAFDVESVALPEVAQGAFEPARGERAPAGELRGAKAAVAYLVPWGSAAAGRFLAAALRQGLRVFSSDRAFSQNGGQFPSGTLIVKVKDNGADLGERMAQLARESGALVYTADSGWVDDGVNFGSRYVVPLRKPAIALAWDTPTASSAAGAVRFVLERQFGYPVTAIRTAQLASANLASFQVLILPQGGDYTRPLGEAGIERIKEWVDAGGTLIALGEAVNFLVDKKVALLDMQRENAVEEPKKSEKVEKPEKDEQRAPGTLIASDAEYDKAIQAQKQLPDDVPGVLVRARLLQDHWITAGLGSSVTAMLEGRNVYTPLAIDKGVNAAYFEPADQLLASGYLWTENRKQLAYKPLVAVEQQGRGIVVAFTADPTFRAMMDGMNVLFLNAVFRGPAHARPAAGE